MTTITVLTQRDKLILCLYPGKITLNFLCFIHQLNGLCLYGVMEQN